MMRVAAILAVREERPYLANCLSHLLENGIDFAIVDNGSTDGSTELFHDARFAPHLAGYHYVPFTGVFVWEEILLAQEQLVRTIDTDWILLQAPDEVMHSNVPGETLASAIERLDARGYDVINFDEFVFLPIDHDYIPDRCGTQPLRHYYFWQPSMRAWRKALNLSNIAFGGHALSGSDFRLSPETFVNRHYIFRDQTHAFEKYARRAYDAKELARGWHWHGFGHPVVNFAFPPAGQLECLASPDDRNLSRAHPHETHYWQWKTQAESASTPTAEIGALRKALAARENDIATLKEGLAEREVLIETLNRSLSERTAEIDALRLALASREAKLSSLDGTILALHTSTSWRITAPLRAVRRRLGRLCYSRVGYPLTLACRALAMCSLTPLRDWRAVHAIASSGFFDREWYLRMNPDVAVWGIDPIRHYVTFGSREGRDPSPSFSTRGYLSYNKDVAAAGANPLAHFILHGAAEGRVGGCKGGTVFSQRPPTARTNIRRIIRRPVCGDHLSVGTRHNLSKFICKFLPRFVFGFLFPKVSGGITASKMATPAPRDPAGNTDEKVNYRRKLGFRRRKPLSRLRLVTTLPPKRIFGGNDFLKAREQSIALRKLGAVVHEFDTEAVYFYDQAKIEQQKHDVVAFRPDALISTPDAAFVLQGGMLSGSTNSSQNRHRNLFIDELELPAVLFWDPPLTKAAWYLLKPWPDHPQESIAGALNSLRWLFLNPNIVHFFPDTGHTQELGKLGIASFDETTWYGQAMGNAFVNSGLHANSGESYDEEVAFFGNIYLAAASKIPYSNEPGIAELRDHVRAFRGADWSLSAFQAYCDAIDALDLNTKSALRLDPDQSFYWRFLYEELSKFMSEDRLHILQSCGRPVAYYGNFNDPESNALMAGKYKLRGALPYDESLADAFRRTRVTIDASSGPFINGFSVRLLSCFAAGGFVLTTRRADIFRAFGPLADEICYQSANEFGGKLEHFLAHDRKRREVTQEIGAIVRRDFTAEALFTRTLPVALEHLRAQGSSRNRNSSI